MFILYLHFRFKWAKAPLLIEDMIFFLEYLQIDYN